MTVLEILTIILKQALLLLDEDFTFTRNQIICIMRALQKVIFSLFLILIFVKFKILAKRIITTSWR